MSDRLEVDEGRLADVCRRFGVVELALFGSRARGEATASSDVDLIYLLDADVRIGWSIHQLEDELADIFGHAVDLVAREALHPLMRDEVLAESRILYAS